MPSMKLSMLLETGSLHKDIRGCFLFGRGLFIKCDEVDLNLVELIASLIPKDFGNLVVTTMKCGSLL